MYTKTTAATNPHTERTFSQPHIPTAQMPPTILSTLPPVPSTSKPLRIVFHYPSGVPGDKSTACRYQPPVSTPPSQPSNPTSRPRSILYLAHHPSILVGREVGSVEAHLEAVGIEDGLLLCLLLALFLLRHHHLHSIASRAGRVKRRLNVTHFKRRAPSRHHHMG